MKLAGYNNINTFFGLYIPQLNTINDILNYWNRKRRTIYFKKFCGLSLYYYF